MKEVTRSEMLTKIGPQVFTNLNQVITQHGQNIPQENLVSLLIILMENPNHLQSKEGRDLFRLAKKMISGSEAESIIFGESISPERKKNLEKVMNFYELKKLQIESALNDAIEQGIL